VSFNASASKPGTGHQISTYAWDFGDGGRASGVNPTHGFGASGTYNVVLVVTDEVGQTATASKQVPVAVASSTPPPTALFVFSPTTPAAGQAVLFNATQSTASPGHTIMSYSWNFGDGNTSTSGPTTSNTFVAAGTYQVVLKVTDDLGLTGTTTLPVPVSSSSNTAPPIASFAFSPQQPALGDTVTFDARNSTAAAGHSIASFKWTFGDNSGTVTATSPTGTTHVYSPASGAGTYVVVLVVTDDVGGTATATQNIQVGSPPAPTADFVATVNATTREVVFDASTSKAAQGQTITDYAWVFGDSATIFHVATKTTTHTYPGSGSFSVTLTVTDSAGRTGVTSKSVVVP
jgi:PKD repeat protein